MSGRRRSKPWYALPVAVLLIFAFAAPASATDPYTLWNHPYRKHDTCAKLKDTTTKPPIRFADTTATGYTAPNPSQWSASTDVVTCPQNSNQVRLDLTEWLVASPSGTHLYFHKGGQGYSPSTVPYGHIQLNDLAPNQGLTGLLSKSTIDSRGADPVRPDSAADSTGFGAGRACTGDYSPLTQYKVTTALGPPSNWVYRSGDGTGSNYAKYANAGHVQGNGTVSYQPLLWSWVGKWDWHGNLITSPAIGGGDTSGYGAERTILQPGTVVTRCNVASLTTRAWIANSGTLAGRVTAVYVRTLVGGNWLYGWIMHSWQQYNGGDANADSSYGARQCVLPAASDPNGCTPDPTPPPPPPPPPPPSHEKGSTLSGTSLFSDDYLISNNRAYKAIMQQDGNFVVYGPSGAWTWQSGTYGQTGAHITMQPDGNLVIYNSGGAPVWSSGTYGQSGTRLVMQDDGNLVIYNGAGAPVWHIW